MTYEKDYEEFFDDGTRDEEFYEPQRHYGVPVDDDGNPLKAKEVDERT